MSFLHASTTVSSSSAVLEQAIKAQHARHDTSRHITTRTTCRACRVVTCRDCCILMRRSTSTFYYGNANTLLLTAILLSY